MERVFKHMTHSLYGEYGVIHGGWGRTWSSHLINLNAPLAVLRDPEQPEGHGTPCEGVGLCRWSKGICPRCLTRRWRRSDF